MNRQEICRKAHENAVEHGFWEKRNSNEHCIMLVITEIAEMVNADRKDRHADTADYRNGLACGERVARDCRPDTDIYRSTRPARVFENTIKDTVEDEMADTYIRLADLAESLGLDFTRMKPIPYCRAYDRFSFSENAFALVKGISKEWVAVEKRLQWAMDYVEKWAESAGIDLGFHVAEKMKYNASRPLRHGKAY